VIKQYPPASKDKASCLPHPLFLGVNTCSWLRAAQASSCWGHTPPCLSLSHCWSMAVLAAGAQGMSLKNAQASPPPSC
jgi:hypothetical protein